MPPSLTPKAKAGTSQWGTLQKGYQYRETAEDEYQRKKKIAYGIVGIVLVVCLGVISGLVTWFVLKDPPPGEPKLPRTITLAMGAVMLYIPKTGPMTVSVGLQGPQNVHKTAVVRLGTTMGDIVDITECQSSDPAYDYCFQIKTSTLQQFNVTVNYKEYEKIENKSADFRCASISWTGSLDSEAKDCIELGDTTHWYGGGLLFEQHWPTQLNKPMTPFVSADILQIETDYGSVLEPYWLSSDGVAISVKWDAKDQPLHTSWNESGDGELCLMSRYRDSPFKIAGPKELKLEYSACVGQDIAHVHKSMLAYRDPWPKPMAIPSEHLFQKPIWSTWVSYKREITADGLKDFVDKISSTGFEVSNIEIDDGYQLKYGDFKFNASKFADPKFIINYVKNKLPQSKVTIWVYPFVNYDAEAFLPALTNEHFVWTDKGRSPAMTSWWCGPLAGLVDFTNRSATNWYFDRLETFRRDNNIDSFKFDGGESNWTPPSRTFWEPSVNPDYYGQRYVEEAYNNTNNGIEVRVGLHTQQLPILVRMLDKDSVEGYDNGLKTLIPTALVFGILGYPFVLPDMIGGNAYRNSTTKPIGNGLLENHFPTPELYLRWLGATVFMPTIQFSITPWHYQNWTYNDPVSSKTNPTEVAKQLLALRDKNIVNLFIDLAKNATNTGYPIIRPLWWRFGDDPKTWAVGDQFMVGDCLMVAPLLETGTGRDLIVQRSIYIPPGSWTDLLRKSPQPGSTKLESYKIDIHEVAHFMLKDCTST